MYIIVDLLIFFIVLLIVFLTFQQGGSQQCGILSLIWVCTKITCAADHSTVSFKPSVFGHIPPLTVFIYTTFELSGYTIRENCNDWKKKTFSNPSGYTLFETHLFIDTCGYRITLDPQKSEK